ncbi:MAG: hypothetical protein H0U69_03370 [Trueperaceae bacterium]|nr:hypothetical protein [Trueperaceae bacterium]
MPWGPDRVRRPAAYVDYSLDWALGGGLAGTATRIGRSQPGDPGVTPPGEYRDDLAHAWQRGGAITTQRSYFASAALALSDGLIEVELVPDIEALLPGFGRAPDCLYPLEALLCEVEHLDHVCGDAAQDLIDAVMPTRLELATSAALGAGVVLALTRGPGLYGVDDRVPTDYTTLGKAPMAVIGELLLRTDARYWFTPGILHIDGRAMPSAASADPPSDPMTGPGALWLDQATESGSVSVDLDASTTKAQAALALKAPDLAEFLKDCDPSEADGCVGRTFETMENGVLAWTEESGDPTTGSYTETAYRITKVGGQVVEERTTTSANRIVWRRDLLNDWTPGLGYWRPTPVLMVVEWTIKTNTFLGCCPNALSHSVENTWVPRLPDERFSPEGDPRLQAGANEAAGVYLSATRETTQTWHAEGWLRTRVEAEAKQDGWTYAFGGENLTLEVTYVPSYKRSSRSEKFIPIGGGKWHIDTRINGVVPMAIREYTSLGTEIVGAHDTVIVNSYTIESDGGPPTVSCDVDPCNPDETCEERAQRRYDEALEEHAEETAVLASRAINRPARLLRQSFAVNRSEDVQVGDFVTTTRGPAVVTRITWSGASPHGGGEPSDETSIECWSALP